MATNREKCIESLSNGELANLLANKCNICKNKINTYSDETNEAVNIENWLSQEAEEDTVHIPQIGKMPKTDKKVEMTEQAYKDILARLDKLEESEYHNAMAIEKLKKINEYESNIDDVEIKTADEMFNELEYDILNIKEFDTRINWRNTCGYINKETNDVILITKLKNECVYRKQNRVSVYSYSISITEVEDKAIHKKIEEMKHA